MMVPTPSPRKTKKQVSVASSTRVSQNDTVIIDSKSIQTPAFPLVSFLWPAKKSTSQWIILPLILMIVGLFRWCTGFWGYSGFQIPPMHGDYEAQRHWAEITTHLPISQWYFYDLEYWGLDYPPLTAYHSWTIGRIGSLIDPSWFALYTSRGLEQQSLKVYMRATVIVSEYLVYVPAAVIFSRLIAKLTGVSKWESAIALVAVLMQPATILIDHGHFQYNTVMLGFVLASMAALMSDCFLLASIFFVGALCFKQMALYFAPAIFAYLLGSCLLPRFKPLRLVGIALATICAFVLAFAPMLLGALYDQYRNINPPLSITDRQVNPLLHIVTPYSDPKAFYFPALLQITQIIHRSFPFARGIFEDKVANLWCLLHQLHKLNVYPQGLLQRVSLMATLIAVLPACMTISLHPRRELLPWAMASCAWGFFLCSFQVHEKSVLLPLLPMTALICGQGGLSNSMRAWIGWANMLGVWTMFPLLKRDELRMPYAVLSLLWAFLIGIPPTSLYLYSRPSKSINDLQLPTKALHLTFYAAMLAWHAVEAFRPPPAGKPDLWVVLNVAIGCAGFGICYLWCTWQLIARSGILEEYLGYRDEQDRKTIEDRAKALPLPWPLGAKSPVGPDESKSRESSPRKVGRPRKSEILKPPSVINDGREASPRKVGRPRKNPLPS